MNRSDVVIANEGHLLTLAANYGRPAAAEHARGVIDGCFNGLLRIEDTEDVAKFAFAVADRVAGRVKDPTAWPLPQVVKVDIAPPPAPAPAKPVKPEPRRYGYWTIFTIGWLCAAVPASIVIVNLLNGGAR